MTSSLSFWIILLAASATSRLFGTTLHRRECVIAVAGVAGLVFVFKPDPLQVATLMLSIAGIVIGVEMLNRQRRMGAAIAGISVILAVWVIGKTASGWDVASGAPILFVGISYMLVKAWSLFKDMLDGKIEHAPPIAALGYLIHLPTLPLGPMHQFGEFTSELETPYKLDGARLIDIGFRIALGLTKILVVASLLAPASLTGLTDAQTITPINLISAAFIYSVVLYCDFSGYCDLAIATSRLMGVDVPENFNWPYIASSLRDFWRRWHITFSRMLTAHVFMPISRVAARKMPKSPVQAAAVANIVTFGFCGYWHGATSNFIIWGLWHAIGLIAQDWNLRRLRKRGWRPPQFKPWTIRARDTALTFTYVSLGWVFFALPLGTFAKIQWGG